MRYGIGIEFEGEKHCTSCPLRDKSDDSCNVQGDKFIYHWEEQMKNCPLQLINSKEGEKG